MIRSLKHNLVVSKTPLRVSFFGGGSDLPSFIEQGFTGKVLGFSLNQHVTVVMKEHGDIFNEKFRLSYSITENTESVDSIKNDIIREAFKFYKFDSKSFVNVIPTFRLARG